MDDWFPTVVHYTGWLLTVALVVVCIFGYYVEAAPGFVAATGMILYKSVRDAARNGNGNGHDDDRWSHLP